jgi:hypothetical protein
MPELTRHRYPERHYWWHIYFGDVQIGTIARCTGCPVDVHQWSWQCGFYPGSRPGEYLDGTAATFDQARSDFEKAWRAFSAKRTPTHYQAARDQRDWTARKYAIWDVARGFRRRRRPIKYINDRPYADPARAVGNASIAIFSHTPRRLHFYFGSASGRSSAKPIFLSSLGTFIVQRLLTGWRMWLWMYP